MWTPGTNSSSSGDWVRSTATLPIAFAQVREDPLIDQRVVEELLATSSDRAPRVLMIASGGETAAWLAGLPLEYLHLVDINPYQLNLTRFKLQLLATESPERRMALLGHVAMATADRQSAVVHHLETIGLPADALGPLEWVSRFGPDHCGRYEWLFARLRDLLREHRDSIEALMQLDDPEQQAAVTAEGTELGDAIEAAFRETMDLKRLVQLFGPDATANRERSFASHFVDRTRQALARFPAAANPFLQEIFLGRFRGPTWPWLTASGPEKLPGVRYRCAAMSDVLAEMQDQSYELIHLSNILDWIHPLEAKQVLQNACRCLTPGGRVIIRQLNSRLAIPEIDCGLTWMAETASELHAADRSFFYRSLHLGTRS